MTSDQVSRLNEGVHQSKTSRELEAERTRKYVSISMRGTTQALGLRWRFKTISTPCCESNTESSPCLSNPVQF